MKKISEKNKGKGFVGGIKSYFSDFGLRQITAFSMIAASIVAIVGISVPNEITLLVGFYLYALASILGMIAAIFVMYKVRIRRAPAYKRSMLALIVLIIVFALALTGLIVTHVNGMFN